MKKLWRFLVICIMLLGICITAKAEYSISLPENIGYIFDRDKAGFTAKVSPGGAQPVTVRCSADDTNIINQAVESADTQFFSLSALSMGKHNISIEILEGNEVKASLSQEITIIKEHQPQLYDALSRAGVVQHRGQSAVQDTERLSLMNAAGVKWARDLLSWWTYEPAVDVWDESYGAKVCTAYLENGTKLHLTLCHYNNLYNADGEKGYAPYTELQLKKFEEYVRRVVTNYPGIKEFEIYNEPNRDATWKPEANIAAYCNLVKTAGRVIRELSPDAVIVAGAVSNTNSSAVGSGSKGDGIRFLREMGRLGVFSYVDAISAHPYTYTNYSDSRYSEFLSLYENVRNDIPDKRNNILWRGNFETDAVSSDKSAAVTADKIGYYTKNSQNGSFLVKQADSEETENPTSYAVLSKQAESNKDWLIFDYSQLVKDIDVYTVKFRYRADESSLSYTFNEGMEEGKGASFSVSGTSGNIRYYLDADNPYRTALKAQWGRWNDFMLVIHKATGVWELYINNTLTASQTASRGGGEFGRLRFTLPGSAAAGAVCIDDIAVIEGDVSDEGQIEGWYGWKEFQITETGFPTISEYGIDEAIAAENIIKSYVYADSKNIDKAFIYEFVSSGTDTNDREHQFGILNYDRSARLAYPALVQYCNAISGADYLGEIQLGSSAAAYLYQKEGEITAVAWAQAEQTAAFSQSADISCYDLYGNPLASENNMICIGSTPIYVTGIDARYGIQAVAAQVSKLYSEANEIAGTSLCPPELSDAAAQDIADAVNENYYYAYAYDTGLSAGERMLFADKLHRAGVFMAALYALINDNAEAAELSQEMISSVKALTEEKADGAKLPFSQAVLKRAQKYYDYAAELAGFAEESSAKNAAVSAKYLICENLCRVAAAYARTEQPDYQNSLRFSITPTKVKSSGEYTVSGNIANMGKTALTADFAVYDNENNRVSGVTSLDIAAGAAAQIELEFTVSDKLPGGHYFYELRAERSGQTLSAQSILIDIEPMGPVDAVSPEQMREFGAEEYCFTVGGKSFLLLDDCGIESSKYFVMAIDSYKRTAFSTDDTQKFNPENPDNIASFVNNIVFPEGIASHIDKNHIWRTEAGYLGGDIPNDYDTECGVSLLSHTEMMTYADRIGWNDLGEKWWLRTVRGANSWWDKGLVVNWEKQRISELDLESTAAVRPVFWLDAGFFESVKLEKAGERIKQYLNSEGLMARGIYSPAELEALGAASQIFAELSLARTDSCVSLSYSLRQDTNVVIYMAVYENNTLCSVEMLNTSAAAVNADVKAGQRIKLIVTGEDGITPLCAPVEI